MVITNLCYILKGRKLLMIDKKRGIGAGKLNVPGGKIDKGETPEQAVIREVKEEIGLDILNPEFRGIVEFFQGNYLNVCYLFVCTEFTGEPTETEEAKPFWTNIDNIPYDRMWKPDKQWVPLILKGKTVLGRYEFQDQKLVSSQLWQMKE
ncbi:MAG: 8-oxo-dGTP diphosphatase [Candidatus Altiarchaeota archaeon]|nr:8-oxo-dGTP diphosphatase [Candidatus Altiarchaeota archaeon]